MNISEFKILKKDGTLQDYDNNKIKAAIFTSAKRVNVKLTEEELESFINLVESKYYVDDELGSITVGEVHSEVESALYEVNKKVGLSYMNYRNYKTDYIYALMNDIEKQIKKTLVDVDRENSNSNSRYISTKRTDIAQIFAKEMFQKMFLSVVELQAMKDGYIYVHDLRDLLLPQFNCCISDIGNIIKGGFELEGIHFNEPKDIRTAVGQVGDVVMVISAQHFGGHSVGQIDKILAPYYEKTIIKYTALNLERGMTSEDATKYARIDAYEDLKQSLQGLENMLNTVVSARGSYPFTTFSLGDVANSYEADVAKAILEVRVEGHGKVGKKKTLIFPKLVFLKNDFIHNDHKQFDYLFDQAINCSRVAMYPDYIGEGHKREGLWVTPMGCRAYLSDYRDPITGKLVFEGRFNLGAVSLNLPMIYMKSQEEKRPFFEVLDEYLEIIRGLHKKRYEYVGKAKASSNPLMFTQGGAYGGNLNPDDKIAPLLKSATISFGVTALHELSLLATGNSLRESNEFALEVMHHINDMVELYKKEDGHLYAIYNSPAENLCGVQVKQFRELYGKIDRVSDKEYFTNSNHLWVGEEISPIEKQDKEEELFHLSKGGHIQYVRITNTDNVEGMKALINRGLSKGFYQGVNFDACACEDCGHKQNDMGETCPICGSKNITEFNRTCGYLGFSRKGGDRTFNDAKMAEIADRKSM